MTARKVDPRELMEQVGTGLFGRKWRAELAENFDPPESMRFINRVMHPDNPTGVVREHHRTQMMNLIDRRLAALAALRKRIEDQPAYPGKDDFTKAQLAAFKLPKTKAKAKPRKRAAAAGAKRPADRPEGAPA